MANDITQFPWIIDTAAVIQNNTGELRIKHLKWVGATTAGHTLVVQDGAGSRNLWEAVAPGANFDSDIDFGEKGILSYGLKVSVIASGKLYVYPIGS